MRFELTETCASPPFQDGALSHSANSPTPLHYTKKGFALQLKFKEKPIINELG